MCTNPITIPTRSLLLSRLHRQPLLQSCSCGKCFECQQSLHQQWYYRIYHEWLDCVSSPKIDVQPYVFFDTLTYDDENLPHMSDFFSVERGSKYDFPCFSRVHIRKFLTRLDSRLRLKYGVDSSVYHRFIAAEYGTDENHTHRPHYHILFFIKRGVDVFTLREEVHEAWNRGITDYVRTNGKKANYFVGRNNRSELAVSNYVAKYVQKISIFEKSINWRIDRYLKNYTLEHYPDYSLVVKSHVDPDNPDKHRFIDDIEFMEWENSFHKSQTYKREKSRLHRLVAQFHCQSNGFGLCALENIDIYELMDNGFLTMPDCKTVIRKIPLPKYYERKIFEKQIYIGSKRVWIPTALGKIYRRKKQLRLVDLLATKYDCLNQMCHLNLNVDFNMLARYVVFYRGRNAGIYGNDVDASEILKIPSDLRWFNHCSSTVVQQIHVPMVSRSAYLSPGGFVFGKYVSPHLVDCIPLSTYIRQFVIDDKYLPSFKGFDKVLDVLSAALCRLGKDKQKLFDFKQDFKNRAKLVERV